jgi:hypothetical protein
MKLRETSGFTEVLITSGVSIDELQLRELIGRFGSFEVRMSVILGTWVGNSAGGF